MADTTVSLGEGSVEAVALKLFYIVQGIEANKRDLDSKGVLTLYHDCLRVVRGTRPE